MDARLLTDSFGSGYPLDYLAARLRCRLAVPAAAPPGNIRPAPGGDSPIRDDFIDQEVKRKRFWLFAQMDEAARALLQPVYVYYEISSLFHLLRLRQGQEKMNKNLLDGSVLPKDFIKSFWRSGNLPDCLKILERYCSPVLRPYLKGAVFSASEGLAITEEKVLEALLSWGVDENSHSTMGMTLSKIVDAYNCRKAAKWLRWNIKKTCTFVPGGMLDTMRLRRIVRRNDLNGLEKYSRYAGLWPIQQGSEWPIEEAVLASLRSRVREQDSIAIVLFYFWSVAVEAKQWRKRGMRGPMANSFIDGAAA